MIILPVAGRGQPADHRSRGYCGYWGGGGGGGGGARVRGQPRVAAW